MAEEEKRSADTLEEIRDLLIEMRDFEKERAEETRERIMKSQQLQEDFIRRQKKFQLVALVVLAPVLLWLLWILLGLSGRL